MIPRSWTKTYAGWLACVTFAAPFWLVLFLCDCIGQVLWDAYLRSRHDWLPELAEFVEMFTPSAWKRSRSLGLKLPAH